MTEQPQLDFEAARRRRDEGAARAARSAGEEWAEAAYDYFCAFAKCFGKPFLVEQCVALANDKIGPPPDARAWGAIAKRAHKAKVVEKVGYAAAATSNCSPKTLWRYRDA
jgi:hypothetical protein